MTKKPVQFRFSYATLARLGWLCRRLDLNRSQVVRLAVAELYEHHCCLVLDDGDDQEISPLLEPDDQTFAPASSLL